MSHTATSSPRHHEGFPERSLRIETLTTGDELLSGEWRDLHSQRIAEVVSALGGEVSRFNTVGDDLAELTAVIAEISERADCCVLTGGLGPTVDDLTLDALSAVSGGELSISEPLWAEILTRYPQLAEAAENNRRQARVLAGGEVLHNALGTAPGARIKINRCVFMAFPGVPHEAQGLIEQALRPWLSARLGRAEHRCQRVIRVALIGESVIAKRVDALTLPPEVRVGYQALGPEHRVKLSAPTQEALDQATALIRDAAAESYLNDRDLPLAAQVIETARELNLTLGCAESCTGGQISAALTGVSGASASFAGSVTSYSEAVKRDVLGVSEATLRDEGVFSAACASEMATGVQRALGVDWTVSVTGVAGPGGGSEANPVGTVYFGWASPEGVITERKRFRGDRGRVQSRAVTYALFKLLQLITRSTQEGSTP